MRGLSKNGCHLNHSFLLSLSSRSKVNASPDGFDCSKICQVKAECVMKPQSVELGTLLACGYGFAHHTYWSESHPRGDKQSRKLNAACSIPFLCVHIQLYNSCSTGKRDMPITSSLAQYKGYLTIYHSLYPHKKKITTMMYQLYQARETSREDFASHSNPGSFLLNTR